MEDENLGWIKLYRSILNNPIVCKDSDHLAVWVYLLLTATHKKCDVIFKNKRQTLEAGQLLTGRKIIADKLHISEYKVQRILKTFEIDQQIAQQTSTQNRLISILKWDEYQNIAQQNAQRVHNECTTSAHIQECNNVINKEYKRKIYKKKSENESERFYSNDEIEDLYYED